LYRKHARSESCLRTLMSILAMGYSSGKSYEAVLKAKGKNRGVDG
jgi:hypothetical protein